MIITNSSPSLWPLQKLWAVFAGIMYASPSVKLYSPDPSLMEPSPFADDKGVERIELILFFLIDDHAWINPVPSLF